MIKKTGIFKSAGSANVDSAAGIGPTDVGYGDSTDLAGYTPGSAMIYKGEPSATELGMLRFGLTNDDLGKLNGILADVMDSYEKLEKRDKAEMQEYLNTVVNRIEEDHLAAPLKLDFSAPDRHYSTETESPFSAARRSKFGRLWRKVAPRRIGDG